MCSQKPQKMSMREGLNNDPKKRLDLSILGKNSKSTSDFLLGNIPEDFKKVATNYTYKYTFSAPFIKRPWE